jgi:copper chaperone NosL
MPEPVDIAAIYVNDMGRASWDAPEPGTWIDARTAFYVLGSDRVGGMQAPEPVPFARKEDAQQFIARHGGEIADSHAIPPASILEFDQTDY